MSDIRKFFVAEQDELLVEADYAQLEVYILAALSGDLALRTDLENGIDMHCRSAEFMYSQPYTMIKDQVDYGNEEWVTKRKNAKRVSFLMQYGGGPKAAEKATGVSAQYCRQYARNYDKRYPDVPKFHDGVASSVMLSRECPPGETLGIGYWEAPTGRLFSFKEAMWNGSPSFSPTIIKNYPCQGTGWDAVALAINHITNLTWGIPEITFVNTVHDSLMWRVHKNSHKWFVNLLYNELPRVGELFQAVYGWDIGNLVFPVEIKSGENWMNMSEETNI